MPGKREHRYSVPNGSEPSVRNGSERAANDGSWTASGGRPAVLDDRQLLELAQQLNHQQGRPPRINELIEAAGGCQRQRASRVIVLLREHLAEKVVRSRLILPTALEGELRSWIDRWMQSASEQLAQVHRELQQQHDDTQDAASELIQEQQQVLLNQRERLADLERMLSELSKQNQSLATENQQIKAERDIALALAEDRLKRIDVST